MLSITDEMSLNKIAVYKRIRNSGAWLIVKQVKKKAKPIKEAWYIVKTLNKGQWHTSRKAMLSNSPPDGSATRPILANCQWTIVSI